ncbi:MAG: PIN domain-containing protein [Acidobacteriota bacterium]
MNKPVILDAGPLGMIAHPRPNPQIAGWYKGIVGSGVEVMVPEVADYEVRRSFLLRGLEKALARLDELKQELTYLPLTTPQMLKAAELWADSWRKGQPTCDPKELDCDVILAAQALSVSVKAIVATDNIKHLARFVDARHWNDISAEDCMNPL